MHLFLVRCLVVAALMAGILGGGAVPATAHSIMKTVIVATLAGGAQLATGLPKQVPGVPSLPRFGS